MRKIVLIDDDRSTAESIASYLNELGYTVSVAYNGWDGLDAVRKVQPDLIISDIRMPKLGGIELCYVLKGLKSKVPVIFISAYEYPEKKMTDLDVYAYVPKPINIFELREHVSKAMMN